MAAELERSYIIVFLDNEIAFAPFVKYNAIFNKINSQVYVYCKIKKMWHFGFTFNVS